MIPFKEKRELTSSGIEDSVSFGISDKDSAHIMGILRDTLYSDKIMAVLREIGANAQDANAAVGRKHVPIKVTLPTIAEPTLRIRDYGPGLSPDDVRNVFSQYGASTKRGSNDAVGMLGIGSKSPFAYSDSFVVTSWHDGSRAIYNAVIDPSERGRIDLMDVSECDPSETGVEVSVAVKIADCHSFEDRAKSLFVHFDPRPVINVELPSPSKTRAITNGWIEEIGSALAGSGKWTAVMGCIPYKIELEQLRTNGGSLDRAAERISGTLRFEVGELQFAASREALKYGDSTRLLLIERINGAIAEYVQTLLSGLEDLSSWEQRLRIYSIARIHLPVPTNLQHFNRQHVQLEMKSYPFTLQSKNWNDRMSNTEIISVSRETRLVIYDERRAIAGYDLSRADVVVRPAPSLATGAKDPLFKRSFEDLLRNALIDGIPIVNLSSIRWTKPSGTVTRPRDRERLRAKAFVLNKGVLAGKLGPEIWTPIDLVPGPDDIFVVIESYQVYDYDFYRIVREDWMLAQKLEIEFPRIIGYKSTKTKPIDHEDCQGQTYKKWRTSGFIKLLMGNPNVHKACELEAYRVGNRLIHGQDIQWAIDGLGADHPVTQFLQATKSGMMAFGSQQNQFIAAANLVHQLVKNVPTAASRDHKSLIKKYPLLEIASDGSMNSSNRMAWVDYIKMVDSFKLLQSNQETE